MIDEEELRRFKEERDQKKKVGNDRKKFIDDIMASQINIGTSNQKYPSYIENSEIPTIPLR